MKKQHFWNIRWRNKVTVLLLIGALFVVSIIPVALAASAQNDISTTTLQTGAAYPSAQVYEKYKPFGLAYDESSDTLTYNGAVVRYFEDFYPVSDTGYAGTEHFTATGTVDVYALRDLTNIQRNADGSHDPSGTLLGLAQRSSQEFQAKDIRAMFHSDHGVAVATEVASMEHNGNDVSASNEGATTESAGINASGDRDVAAATSVEGGDPAEWADLFAKYAPFGLSYDAITGDLYYQGKLVRYFEDSLRTGPNTYEHYLQSSNAEGMIDVHTVFGNAGEMIGIELYSQDEFDQHTSQLYRD